MPKPSEDCVTAMVRDVLGPEMKAAGFRRSARVFWRKAPRSHIILAGFTLANASSATSG
jgi:hypothetical protein